VAETDLAGLSLVPSIPVRSGFNPSLCTRIPVGMRSFWESELKMYSSSMLC